MRSSNQHEQPAALLVPLRLMIGLGLAVDVCCASLVVGCVRWLA